jgi:ABC-type amino acid transport substrate-binding protein
MLNYLRPLALVLPLFLLLSIFTLSEFASAATNFAQAPQHVVVLMAEQKGEKDQVLPVSKNIQQLLKFLEAETAYKFEVQHFPWRRVLQNGANGEGLILGIYKNPEREQVYTFSDPVFSDKIWLVTRCNQAFTFNKIADLKGKTIGIVQGSSAGDEFDSQVNILFKAEYNNSSLAGRFLKLYLQRMDAFLLYEPRTNYKEVQRELNQMYAANIASYQKTKEDIFCIQPKPISTIESHFAMRLQGDQTLIKKINQALAHGKKNGELDRIFAK